MTIISAICGLEWIVLIQCLNPSSYGVANDWIWVFNRSPSEVTKQMVERFPIPSYMRRHSMVMQ